MNRVSIVSAIMAGCVLSGAALADMVNISGNAAASSDAPNSYGAYTGTVTFTSNTATTGTLAVSLTNTSTFAGGRITGLILLNNAEWAGVTVALASTSNAAFTDTSTESGSPFGDFRGGMALGGSWLGGGSPNSGTPIGSTLTATFNISGTGVGAMTAANFVNPVAGHYQFVVRFRGFENGGSDKLPAQIVPAPGAAAALFGAGGLMAARRRRR
jgi:hypothetical protein